MGWPIARGARCIGLGSTFTAVVTCATIKETRMQNRRMHAGRAPMSSFNSLPAGSSLARSRKCRRPNKHSESLECCPRDQHHFVGNDLSSIPVSV